MAGQQVEIFKPKLDNRYADEEVVSHNQNKIKSTPVENPNEILILGASCDVIGIDEAQFFDESIIKVAKYHFIPNDVSCFLICIRFT